MNEEMIKKVLGLLDSRYGFEFSFKKKNWTLVTFNGQEYLIVQFYPYLHICLIKLDLNQPKSAITACRN